MTPTWVRPPIPRTVWALGLVGLFMDVSSKMIHALLRLCQTNVVNGTAR